MARELTVEEMDAILAREGRIRVPPPDIRLTDDPTRPGPDVPGLKGERVPERVPPTVDLTTRLPSQDIAPPGPDIPRLERARPRPGQAELTAHRGSWRDILPGMNERIANLLSVPPELVNSALETAGLNFMERGDARRAIIAGFRRAGFLPHAAEESWNTVFGRMGPSSVDALLLLAGTTAIMLGGQGSLMFRPLGAGPGPRVPTMRGPTGLLGGTQIDESALQEAARLLGSSWLMAPTRTTAMTIGAGVLVPLAADVGGTIGERAGSIAGPTGSRVGRGLGETVGAFGGAITGGAAADLALRAGLRATGAVSRGVQSLTRVPGERTEPFSFADETFPRIGARPPRTEPLVGEEAPVVLREYIGDQVNSEVSRMDAAVRLAVRGLAGPRGVSPPSAATRAERFMREIDRLEVLRNRIENRAWGLVDLRAIADDPIVEQVHGVARDMRNRLVGLTHELPEDQIRHILNLGFRRDARGNRIRDPDWEPPQGLTPEQELDLIRNPPDNAFLREPVTLEQLRLVRSGVLHAIRVANSSTAGVPPNRALAHNLNQLQESLLEAMSAVNPGDASLAVARNVSRELHNRFTRSALAEILAQTARGGDRVAREEAADVLLRGSRMFGAGGPRSVVEAGQPIPEVASMDPRGHTAFISRGERTVTALENAISAQFAELATAAGRERQIAGGGIRDVSIATGTRAMQLIESNRRALEPLERLTSLVGRRMVELQTAQERLRALENSALARYFHGQNVSVERGITSMLSGSHPVSEVGRVVNQITGGLQPHRWNRLSMEAQAALRGLQNGVIREFMSVHGGTDFIAARNALQGERWQGIFRAVLTADQRERLERIFHTGASIQERDPRALRRYAQTGIGHIAGLWGGSVAAHSALVGTYGHLSLPAQGARLARTWIGRIHQETAAENLVPRAIFDSGSERLLLDILPSNRGELHLYAQRFAPLIRRVQVVEEMLSREYEREGEPRLRRLLQ